MKRLIIFDLDGTLAESKSPLDAVTAPLIERLLDQMDVAIISGGDWPQFEKQVISKLGRDSHLNRLSLLPTCGTKFYRFESDWKRLYAEDFTSAEKHKIVDALNQVMVNKEFAVSQTWGEVIEDRGSQITFSALGQQAPLEEKRKWDPDFAHRLQMKARLGFLIPEFSIRLGGTTSVDITRPGIDKAFGIRKLRDILGIPIGEMIFVGDALFPGGNDHPARETGVVCIQVRDPAETRCVMEAVLACVEIGA